MPESARVPWSGLPTEAHALIRSELGSDVVDVLAVEGGFSPGFVGILRTASGDRCFVKAMSRHRQPGWVFLYEREARIAPGLPTGAPFPGLRFVGDDGDWVVLGFDELPGRMPAVPWDPDEVRRVLDAHLVMAEALGPSPVEVEDAGAMWGGQFRRWRDIAADGALVDRLPPPWRARVPDLAELEAPWPDLCGGEHLVHLDLRADNVLLDPAGGPNGVHVVDWAFAARGAPWLDLVCLLANVAQGGGTEPEAIWRAHPWHDDVSPEAFDAFLAGWAGMLTHVTIASTTPELESLRRYQGAQAAAARDWLARRRAWADVLP